MPDLTGGGVPSYNIYGGWQYCANWGPTGCRPPILTEGSDGPMVSKLKMEQYGESLQIVWKARNSKGEEAREVRKGVKQSEVDGVLDEMRKALEERIGPF